VAQLLQVDQRRKGRAAKAHAKSRAKGKSQHKRNYAHMDDCNGLYDLAKELAVFMG